MWWARPELEPWTDFADYWLDVDDVIADGTEPNSQGDPFIDAAVNLRVRGVNQGAWDDVAGMFDELVARGSLVEAAFLDAPPNGRAVVTALTYEGIVPILHVWDHGAGMKFWVYNTPPGDDDLGRTRAAYTEVRAAEADWQSRLFQLLVERLEE
jgi:hypothetical protein